MSKGMCSYVGTELMENVAVSVRLLSLEENTHLILMLLALSS